MACFWNFSQRNVNKVWLIEFESSYVLGEVILLVVYHTGGSSSDPFIKSLFG